MNRRIRWILMPVFAIAATMAPMATPEAACADCRPAPPKWSCDDEKESCPLYYPKCWDLPL